MGSILDALKQNEGFLKAVGEEVRSTICEPVSKLVEHRLTVVKVKWCIYFACLHHSSSFFCARNSPPGSKAFLS